MERLAPLEFLSPPALKQLALPESLSPPDLPLRVPQELLEELAEEAPLGRNGTPEDVARAMEYLASAEFITGHVLNVDGGFAI